jgi:probable rRNA maturation factor
MTTIKKTLQTAGYNKKKITISLSLVRDRTIKTLNKSFRGKNSATDVLSFIPLDICKTQNGFLGDIIISVDTAKKNAKEQEVTFKEELLRLSVHGVLHLLGYDHEFNAKKKDADKMFDLQEKIINKLRVELL